MHRVRVGTFPIKGAEYMVIGADGTILAVAKDATTAKIAAIDIIHKDKRPVASYVAAVKTLMILYRR